MRLFTMNGNAHCTALLALLFMACRSNESSVREAVVADAGYTAAPTVARSLDGGAPPCPGPLAMDTSGRLIDPRPILHDAVVVCVGERRFEGAALHDLTTALGETWIVEESMPKCRLGYPRLGFLTASGTLLDIDFCANVGAGRAYHGGMELIVAHPEKVDQWLQSRDLMLKL